MNNRKEVLNRAAHLLKTKGWTQGQYARDKDGNEVVPHHPDAECFCMIGAIHRAYWEVNRCHILDIGAFLNDWSTSWIDWNDHCKRTKEEVIAALEELANREVK